MPGMVRSFLSASSWLSVSSRSRLSATLAALMMVSARTPSTPARCQSQDGMRRQVRGSGKTRMPRGAGPGGGVAVLRQQDPPCAVGFEHDDLLLEYRGDERLHQAAGTADPQPRVPQRGVTDHRVRVGGEAGGVVVTAESAG